MKDPQFQGFLQGPVYRGRKRSFHSNVHQVVQDRNNEIGRRKLCMLQSRHVIGQSAVSRPRLKFQNSN